MDPVQAAASAMFSPAVIAALGPLGAVAVFMVWIAVSHTRGREERLARANEEMAKALREDQRELFEEQSRQLDDARASNASLDARARALDDLVARQRRAIFDLYVLARENAHAAANAHQLLISAHVKERADITPPVWPELPKAD